MARRKSPRTRKGNVAAPVEQIGDDMGGSAAASESKAPVDGIGDGIAEATADGRDAPPPAAAVTISTVPGQLPAILISIAIVLHLFALLLSYAAIIEPSSTHSQLLDASAPYIRSTHFAADGRPFYLAHDTPDEQPHRLQFASRGDKESLVIDTQTEWTTIEPVGVPGLGSWDRYGRWVTLAATLAESEQSSLVAALLLPLISADESIDAVRIVRLPTQLTTVAEDTAPPVYLARVARTSGRVDLVSVTAKRLSTYGRDDEPRQVSGDVPVENSSTDNGSEESESAKK